MTKFARMYLSKIAEEAAAATPAPAPATEAKAEEKPGWARRSWNATKDYMGGFDWKDYTYGGIGGAGAGVGLAYLIQRLRGKDLGLGGGIASGIGGGLLGALASRHGRSWYKDYKAKKDAKATSK